MTSMQPMRNCTSFLRSMKNSKCWLPKLSDVELDREELSTKFDEANQTIGALRFKNNFLLKKTKKLEVELSQV